MSGPEDFDFDEFVRQAGAYAQQAAEAADGNEQTFRSLAAAETTLLIDLDRKAFAPEVRKDLAFMDEFLATHPAENLDGILKRCRVITDLLEIIDIAELPEKIAEKFSRANRLAERVYIISTVAMHRAFGSDYSKIDLQAHALSSEILSDDERLLWAAEIDALLPDEQGINLLDSKAISSAVALYGIEAETTQVENSLRRMTRDILVVKLEELYSQFRIPGHDDLAAVTRGIASAIAWEETAGEPGPSLIDLERYREKSVAMRWPPGAYDQIVAALREIKAALNDQPDDSL